MDSNKPDISIIIITLARQTLYCTLDSLVEQEINKTFEIVLINQGQIDKKKLDKIILKGKSNKTFQGIRVFNYEKNLHSHY